MIGLGAAFGEHPLGALTLSSVSMIQNSILNFQMNAKEFSLKVAGVPNPSGPFGEAVTNKKYIQGATE